MKPQEVWCEVALVDGEELIVNVFLSEEDAAPFDAMNKALGYKNVRMVRATITEKK